MAEIGFSPGAHAGRGEMTAAGGNVFARESAGATFEVNKFAAINLSRASEAFVAKYHRQRIGPARRRRTGAEAPTDGIAVIDPPRVGALLQRRCCATRAEICFAV